MGLSSCRKTSSGPPLILHYVELYNNFIIYHNVIIIEIKYAISVMCLNHPETLPTSPLGPKEKLSSTKPAPGAKKVEDHCSGVHASLPKPDLYPVWSFVNGLFTFWHILSQRTADSITWIKSFLPVRNWTKWVFPSIYDLRPLYTESSVVLNYPSILSFQLSVNKMKQSFEAGEFKIPPTYPLLNVLFYSSLSR